MNINSCFFFLDGDVVLVVIVISGKSRVKGEGARFELWLWGWGGRWGIGWMYPRTARCCLKVQPQFQDV